MNSARTNIGNPHLAGAALAVVMLAACGLSVDDLFTSGAAGGGGAGGASTTTTTTHTSSHASTSSSTTTSASSTSSSTSASSTSSSSTTSSSSSSGGTCAHAVCDTGDALVASCSACAGAVCAADSYCCTTAWDAQCTGAPDKTCGSCCGNGKCDNTEDCKSCPSDCGACAPDPTCPHSACFVGAALDGQKCRDACVDQVCAQKPACCGNATWDGSCTLLAAQLCGPDPCITSVCAAMPSCCATGWTQACVDKAKTTCQTQCDCAHSICEQGGPLAETCNPCAKAVCKADGYCCTTNWDGICVGESSSICGISCQ